MTTALVYPMCAMVLLTFTVLFITFFTRVHAVRTGKVKMKYFKHLQGEPSEQVLKTGRHFSNLFEIPVLFYAACLVAMQLQMPVEGLLIWAWAFVGARVLQAIIHIGPNKVFYRMCAYMAGCLCVMAIWGQIFIHVVQQ